MLKVSSVWKAFTRVAGVLPSLGFANADLQKVVEVNSIKGKLNSLQSLIPTVRSRAMRHVPMQRTPEAEVSETRSTPLLKIKDLKHLIRAIVQNISGESSIASSDDLSLSEIDSLSAVEIASSLEKALDLNLPATIVFDFPSVTALAEQIRSIGTKEQPDEDLNFSSHTEVFVRTIYGSISSRLPSAGSNLDSITQTPFFRWKAQIKHFDPPFGGWLTRIEHFDNGVFSIRPAEALCMDPQQRLVLEQCTQVTAVGQLKDKRSTGVFVGMQQAEFGTLVQHYNLEVTSFAATGTPFSVTAGRVAYHLGLQGPAMSIDTACSSALVASHTSKREIYNCLHGAICSSVNLMLSEMTTRATFAAGMLSPSGRCKTMDDSADGYVRSEAIISMYLSIEPNEIICWDFLMLGSQVNQDGRSSSLTAPNGPSQQRVIRGALSDAHCAISDIIDFELHGTGTSLGDPIEIGALLSIGLQTGLAIQITAAKSMHGHAEPAAGFVGLTNLNIILRQNDVLPMSHLRTMNHYIQQMMQTASSSQSQIPRQNAPATST